MINILTLARKELHDALQNRWFLLYSLAFTLLVIAISWFGGTGGELGSLEFERTAASMINIVLLIIPLMGLTLGALSLAGEREMGTLLYLLSQPVTHLEALSGKFIGLGAALLSTLLIGFGLSTLMIIWQGGALDLVTVLWFLAFSCLLAWLSLGLGMLISAAARKASTAIGLALFVWLLLVFLGDLGIMGSAVVLRLQADELLYLTMLNPLQVYKIAALLNLRGSLEVLGASGLYAVRTFGDSLVPLLVGLLVAWIIVPFSISWGVFKKRGVLP